MVLVSYRINYNNNNYYHYESRTQGTQSTYTGQNNTEKIHIKQHRTLS